MPLLREKMSELLLLAPEDITIPLAVTDTDYEGDAIDLQIPASLSFGFKLDAELPELDEGKITYRFQFAPDDAGSPGVWFEGSSDAIMPRYKRPPNNTLENTELDINSNPYQQPAGVAGDAPGRYCRIVLNIGSVALTAARTITITPVINPMVTPSQLWKKTNIFPNDGRP
jgi:hypothetical protein